MLVESLRCFFDWKDIDYRTVNANGCLCWFIVVNTSRYDVHFRCFIMVAMCAFA